MVVAILDVAAPVLKTQGNLNNDIGVPLMLLRLTDEYRFAAIEMGANHRARSFMSPDWRSPMWL